MSAGSFFGAVFITVVMGGLLMVMGKVVTILNATVNAVFANGVYYQGGIDAYNMLVAIFAYAVPVIIIAGAWANYIMTQISKTSMEV